MAFGLKKMSIFQTETTQADKERGSGRAFLLPDDKALSSLDEATGDRSRSDRLALALRGASTDRLKVALVEQIKQLNTDGALRVSAELTARGIAPCFRGTFDKREWWLGIPDADFILILGDLQWIITMYPNHRTEWQRAQPIFDPRRFRKTAEYLHWEGQRSAGQIAKALALTEAMQRESAWIQCLHVERWRHRLFKRLPIAHARITATIRENDRRLIGDQDATIKRRSDLWLCAELADWKPQRTASLYAMMTGETLPRNVVAKQLEKMPKVRRTDEV